MKTLTRYQSRQISRNRLRIKAISPCSAKYDNPFAHLLNSLKIDNQNISPEERKIQHEIRMIEQNKRAAKRKKQLAKRKKH